VGDVERILKKAGKKKRKKGSRPRKQSAEMILPLEMPELKVTLALPFPSLSPSQIEMYLRCPRQYWYRYIQKEVAPPEIALVEGSSHHEGMKVNNHHKRKKGSDLKVATIYEVFADYFADHKKEVKRAGWQGEKEKDILARGKGMITDYRAKFAPRLRPRFIEEKVEITVGKIPVMGYIDVAGSVRDAVKKTERKKSVVDYKTVGRKKSKDELEGSLQLTMYAIAARKRLKIENPQAGFLNLLKGPQEVVWQPTEVGLGRERWFNHVTVWVAEAISRGSFPPCSPTSWACDPRWCGYYKKCRGGISGG
jgi:CRISPR/Cas system-associated exonuclease Cas4 (RecB family)